MKNRILILSITSFFSIIMVSCGCDPVTAGAIAYTSYKPIVDKGYAAEAETYLKDVSNAATIYEDAFGGQQPTLDDLKQRGLLLPSASLERDWKIEMSGDLFTATSTDEMPGGAGNTVSFNRQTGKFSGYGFENKSGK